MADPLHSLRLLSVLFLAVVAEPVPGRIPKVYNALITSNQNLEPSKAYPLYQPVLHDPFPFSLQPAVFYGNDFFGNSIIPAPALPKELQPTQSPPATPEAPTTAAPAPDASAAPEDSTSTPDTTADQSKDSSSPTPPLTPPSTESPIPLNEFGLPPQILPLGSINPAYTGFTQLGPYTYPYPGLRFYPYDPFSLGPYASVPAVFPFGNILGQSFPIPTAKETPTAVTPAPADQSPQTPPSEPSDLNILNYSSKDPAIPNVPPPPLPQGGLKSDKSD